MQPPTARTYILNYVSDVIVSLENRSASSW